MQNIDQIVQAVRQSTDYHINKEILREKILTDLHLAYNGGLFLIRIELLAYLATEDKDIIYLEDIFHNPIEINRQEFQELCREQYQKVMNRWHQEHAELKRIRKI